MNIIKSLNSKQKQAKATNKIKTPTQVNKQPLQGLEINANKQTEKTLAELQAAIKIK